MNRTASSVLVTLPEHRIEYTGLNRKFALSWAQPSTDC